MVMNVMVWDSIRESLYTCNSTLSIVVFQGFKFDFLFEVSFPADWNLIVGFFVKIGDYVFLISLLDPEGKRGMNLERIRDNL